MQRHDLVPLPILGLLLLTSLCYWRWAVGLRLELEANANSEGAPPLRGVRLAGLLNIIFALR
jgi:hypothetical protein